LSQKEEFLNTYCNNTDRATPLHFAVMAESYDNCKTLLKYGAKPNVQDANGNTPMHYAVLKKNL